jgi:hypothetical protein
LITLATLRTKTAKELGALAKDHGVAGAASLRKDDLIQAILKAHKARQSRARRQAKSASVEAKKVARTGAKKIQTRSASAKSGTSKTGPAAKPASKSKTGAVAKASDASKKSGSAGGKSKTGAAVASAKAPASRPASKPAASAAPVKPAGKSKEAAKPAPAASAKPASKPEVIQRSEQPKSVPKPPSRPSRAHRTPSGSEIGPLVNTPAAQKLVQMSSSEREALKDLSGRHRHELGESASVREDRVVLLVRDAYWLQANWQVTRQSVERAQAAMAEHWHTSRPVLRLYEVDGGSTTGAAERPLRDIEIHGGVNNWYLDVAGSPRSLMAAIGYLGGNGKFHAITRSNRVTTPAPNSADVIDEHWSDIAENYEKIYAQSGGGPESGGSSALQEVFEEQLRRPMGSSFASRYGINPEGELPGARDFDFEIDAEMVIFGKAPAESRVTMSGEPIKLREDGSFTVRVAMPDRRQVIPITAASTDGFEQRTIVLAIERNTKVMEPKLREDVD